MGVEKNMKVFDVEKGGDAYQRESKTVTKKSYIKWTKVDYLWAMLGFVGLVLVVKGVFVLADASNLM